MKKNIGLLIVIVLFSCSALAAGSFLPFVPQPQQEGNDTDLFQLQQRFLDCELEMGEVLRQMKSFKQEQQQLENQLNSFYLTGYGFGQFRRFNITGEGKAQAKDFLGLPLWYDGLENEPQTQGSKANQRIYLTIVGKPSPQIEVASSIVPSAVWAGSSKLQLDNVVIRTNFNNIKTSAGTFWAEFSPLTLYYPKHLPWFESSFFTKQRTQWEEEQGIVGNKRKLEGLSLEYSLNNFSLQGLMAKVKDNQGGTFHRFLTGYAINILPDSKNILGANWIRLADDHVSGSGSAMSSELLGLNWNWGLWRNLSIAGELVRSQYDNSLTETVAAAEDTAAWCELRWEMESVILQLRSLNVGPYYYAPSSQSRTYTLSDLTRFGAIDSITAMGGIVSQANMEALPYGLATPNRKGYQLRALYAPTGRVQAALERIDLHQVHPTSEDGTIIPDSSTKQHFIVERLGGEIDLTGILRISNGKYPQRKLKLLGQMEQRSTSPVALASLPAGQTCFKETLCDWGLAYELRPEWNLLLGGKKKSSSESEHKSTSFGLEVAVSPQTTVCVVASTVDYQDNGNSANNYKAKLAEVSLKAYF